MTSDPVSAQKVAIVSKTPRVVGSKDDLFGMGQPKQRRYLGANHRLSVCQELAVPASMQHVVGTSVVLRKVSWCRVLDLSVLQV